MSRGRLRIYLGAAPGVGKTYAMLGEGARRAARGSDVVVGYVETHGRPSTAAMVGDLEVIPRRRVEYRGTELEEMDLDAILARRPDVAIVDELAHTNVPGSTHPKRWQDVAELLEHGIDVISTVNVQHLESLNDVVERITGVRQRETVPDHVVREADQVELVDMTPEALRRRMAHGNIYAADKVDAALANYFRIGNLSALRELALLWVADKVDDGLQQYLEDHDIDHAWEARERVVVAVTGAPSGERLIRRAARIATRRHGDLIGVHIRPTDGLAAPNPALLVAHQQLLADLGGSYREVVTADVADGLLATARSARATQIILGSTQRSRWGELVHGSIINKVIRGAGEIDIHVISADRADEEAGRLPLLPTRRRSPLSHRRQALGWLIMVVGLPVLVAAMLPARDNLDLSTVFLLLLVLVGAVAAIGGLRPALATAIAADVAGNWYFIEPYYTLTIAEPEQLFAFVMFIATGVLVSLLVEQAARRSAQAQRARAEAEALALAAGSATGPDPLAATLAHLRVTFDQDAVLLVSRASDGTTSIEAVDGEPGPAGRPVDVIEVGPDRSLQLIPGGLTADDHRVLATFAGRVAETLERRGLESTARDAEARSRSEELRTAILRAVSHDLRTPLASIKASSTSLLQQDVSWTEDERREFAETIDEEADRLDNLVENLLDMSRIEAGAVATATRAVGMDDIFAAALDSLSQPTDRVTIHAARDLPAALADAGLLERVIANLVANALRHSPVAAEIRLEAATIGDRAVIRVVDQGPGIAQREQERAFDPFQRLGDTTPGGVGLGLAVASGFMAAMDGDLTLDDTPGGGLTVTLTLPLAERASRDDAPIRSEEAPAGAPPPNGRAADLSAAGPVGSEPGDGMTTEEVPR